MAYYYSLRGWLEIDPEYYAELRDKLIQIRDSEKLNKKQKLYMGGWCWNNTTINWTGYIFYGGDVTEEGFEFLREVLHRLVLMKMDISGFFHAQGEDGEKNLECRIIEDVVSVSLSKPI